MAQRPFSHQNVGVEDSGIERTMATMSDTKQAAKLTKEQRLKLAECYAEYCGVEPHDENWQKEMIGSKKFIDELLAIWNKRSRRFNGGQECDMTKGRGIKCKK